MLDRLTQAEKLFCCMTEWYYSEFGQTKGPVSETEIVKKLLKEELELDSYVMNSRDELWKKVKDLPALLEQVHKPEPVTLGENLTPEILDKGLAYGVGNLGFYIPIRRFILMSIVSFGLYQLYWFYKQWYYIAAKKTPRHRPVRMTVAYIFFPFWVLRDIEFDVELNAVERASFNGIKVALTWIILGVILELIGSNLSDNHSLTNLLSCAILSLDVFALIPVQNYINRVNSKLGNTYNKPGIGHYLCLGAGFIELFVLLKVWKFIP